MTKRDTMRHPIWDHTAGSLLFGLEQEHFVLRAGRAPTVEDIDGLLRSLARDGFAPAAVSADGQVTAVEKTTPTGFIRISNDFCTHILEAAFPPARDLAELGALYHDTWGAVGRALSAHGLTLILDAALPSLDFEIVVPPHPRRAWYERRVRPAVAPARWNRYFTTLMCATQIHLNIHDEAVYARFSAFYETEYLVPLLFSNSPVALGIASHCSRPLVWRDNQPDDYPAWGIPDRMPRTRSEYEAMLAGCRELCRDYSFIAVRSFGTLEFRTACAQPTFDRIEELIALRLATAVTSARSSSLPRAGRHDAGHFYGVCATGRADPRRLDRDHAELCAARAHLLPAWRAPFERVLARMRAALDASHARPDATQEGA